jgi:hypothetical protein
MVYTPFFDSDVKCVRKGVQPKGWQFTLGEGSAKCPFRVRIPGRSSGYVKRWDSDTPGLPTHTKEHTTYAWGQAYVYCPLTGIEDVRRFALLSHHLGMVRNFRCSTLKCSAFRQARFQSTNPHFYQNRQLEQYAAREAQRLSLRQLVRYLVHTGNCAI